MAAIIPSSQQMQQFLVSRSPAQLAAIIAALQAQSVASPQQPAATVVNTMNATGPPQTNPSNGGAIMSVTAPTIPVFPQNRAARRAGIARRANIAKRPLNSWMAFRSYYSPIFSSQQQKDISGFLTVLWAKDPFQAKWSILAKAYSIIRDHKGNSVAPLDAFLAITCPQIGIISPDAYLSMLGWQIIDKDGGKTMHRQHDGSFNLMANHLRTTNLSVEDIIRYCHAVGYIVDDQLQGLSSATTSTPAVASLTMAAQPTTTFTAPTEVANARRRNKVARRARNARPQTEPASGLLSSFQVEAVTPAQQSLPQMRPTESIDPRTDTIKTPTDGTNVASEGSYSLGTVDLLHSAHTPGITGFHPNADHHDAHLGPTLTTEHPTGTFEQYQVASAVTSSEQNITQGQDTENGAFQATTSYGNVGPTVDPNAVVEAQVELFQDMGDEYPFNYHFDPDGPFGLEFNPADGDGFNTFNISNFNINDWLDPELFDI